MKMTYFSRQVPSILGAGLLLGALALAGCGGGGGGSSSTTGGDSTSTTGSTTSTTGSTTATTGSTTATTGSTTSTTGSTTATTGTTSTTGSTTSTTGSTGSTTTTGSTTSTTGSTTSTTGSTTSTTGSTTSTTSGGSATISNLNFSGGFPTSPPSPLLISNTKTNQSTITGQPAKEANSLFSKSEFASLSTFHTTFTFTIVPGTSNLDGITFCVQGLSDTALGGSGDKLGYGNISDSIAVKFDTHQNTGDPSANSTGLFVNGAAPVGGIDLTPSGIDLHSGDVFQVDISYTHNTLTSTITDTATGAHNTQVYRVNIPQVVGSNAGYVGFTSAQDANIPSQEKVMTWTISSP